MRASDTSRPVHVALDPPPDGQRGSWTNVADELGILEPQQVADLLKLRHSTVLDLSRRGVLPAFKIGKHWRFRRDDLEEWLANPRDAA
jgi:excisionase family DNA binding protein